MVQEEVITALPPAGKFEPQCRRHPGSRPGARQTRRRFAWTPCGGLIFVSDIFDARQDPEKMVW
jgi:hypothetical protein